MNFFRAQSQEGLPEHTSAAPMVAQKSAQEPSPGAGAFWGLGLMVPGRVLETETGIGGKPASVAMPLSLLTAPLRPRFRLLHRSTQAAGRFRTSLRRLVSAGLV